MATQLNPPIDYTSKDWASFRQDMIDAITTRLPEWTSRNPNDFGVVFIEAVAYVADILSFYGDRIANEAFLDTATQRASVLALSAMLDYRPTGNLAASLTLQFTTRAGGGSVTIPAGTQVSTVPVAGQTPLVFETASQIIIADVVPNTGTVTANQGTTVTGEAAGTSDGTASQVFLLHQTPVIDSSQTVYVNEGAGAVAWQYFANLLDSGPNDNAYSTFIDENNVLNIVFGDNVNGRIPPNGSAITCTYRVGGGAAGNVGVGTVTQMVAAINNVTAVTNTTAGTGGADAESLDDIRVNAPKSLTTLNRAVTLKDYADLAVKVSGIAKAVASATVYTSVTLYVAPFNGSSTNLATTAQKNAVQTYLSDKKMINATVTILDPTYVPINVTAAVNVLPTFGQAAVQSAVNKAVLSALAFDNVDFGDRVSLSAIYRAIHSVPGVDYATISVLSRTGSGVADVQLATNEIPSAGTVTITATGGITT